MLLKPALEDFYVFRPGNRRGHSSRGLHGPTVMLSMDNNLCNTGIMTANNK